MVIIRKALKILISVLVFAVALEAALRARAWFGEDIHIALPSAGTSLKVLVIGDSVMGTDPSSTHIASYLQRELALELKTPVEVIDKAIPANNTDLVKGGISRLLSENKAQVVILMLGKSDFRGTDMILSDWLQSKSLVWRMGTILIDRIRPIAFYALHGSRVGAPTLDASKPAVKYPAELTDIKAFENLAKRQIGRGDYLNARAKLEDALSLLKEKNLLPRQGFVAAELHAKLAFVLANINQFAAAISHAETAQTYLKHVTMEPNSSVAKVYLDLSMAFKNSKTVTGHGLRRAKDMAQEALRLDPNSSEAHKNLAWIYMQRKRFTLARDQFAKAMELDPTPTPFIIRAIFQTAYYDGKYTEASEILQKLRKHDDYENLILVQLAGLELLQNHERLSNQYFAEAAKVYPQSREVYLGNIQWMIYLGKPNEADEVYAGMSEKQSSLISSYTAANYRQIVAQIFAHGALPVAVQYPSDRVESLKTILMNQDTRMPILSARDYVLNRPAGVHIQDIFNFDLEHLTPKGAQLVAEGIAHDLKKYMISLPKFE